MIAPAHAIGQSLADAGFWKNDWQCGIIQHLLRASTPQKRASRRSMAISPKPTCTKTSGPIDLMFLFSSESQHGICTRGAAGR